MDFKCQTAPLEKLGTTASGIRYPLCNDCVQIDCTNPIRSQTVMIMGLPSKWRIWKANSVVRQVVDCEGYVKNNEAANDI